MCDKCQTDLSIQYIIQFCTKYKVQTKFIMLSNIEEAFNENSIMKIITFLINEKLFLILYKSNTLIFKNHHK